MRAGLLGVMLALAVVGATSSWGGEGGQDPKLSSGSQYVRRIIDKGDVAELKEQLDFGLDPNERFEDGHTMLLWAARSGRVEIARMLIANGAQLEAALPDGRNALMLAAIHYSPEMAQLFLESGIDPNLQDRDGNSALHHCVNWGYIDVYIEGKDNDQAQIIRRMSEWSASMNVRDKFGRTPLMLAAKFRHFPQLRALIAAGANVDERDAKGRSALTHCATSGKDSEIVRALFRVRAGVQLMDALQLGDPKMASDLLSSPGARATLGEFDQTTLMEAAELGNYEIVESLIKQGVDVNQYDARGFTALHLALGRHPKVGQIKTYWSDSRGSGSRASIVQLLLKSGAAVDAVCTEGTYLSFAVGETALVWAVKLNQTDVMKVLLSGGADPKGRASKTDQFARPPLVVAAQNGHVEAMKVLLDAGAPPNLGAPLDDLYWGRETHVPEPSLSTRTTQIRLLLESGADPNYIDEDSQGVGPLMRTVVKRNVPAARLLLKANANVDKAATYDGSTALMVAVQNNHIEMVKLLLEFNAKTSIRNKKGQTARDIAKSMGYSQIVTLIDRKRK